MKVKQKTHLNVSQTTVLKHFLILFLPLFILTSAIISVIGYIDIKNERFIIETTETHNVDLQVNMIESNLKPIVADLMILSTHHELQLFLDNPEAVHQKALEKEFFLFSFVKKFYDQVRFIDDTGMEIVRINVNAGNPEIVPEDGLQFKGDRYYFNETLQLGPNEVFISPFDLNVEQGKIEQPIKPMIRFGMPVFDSNNRKRGIIVVNYLGAILISNLGSKQSSGQTIILSSENYWLINSEGYWLKGSTPEDEWGFMYADRKDRTIGKTFPDVWQKVSSAETGQFQTKEGLFTYATVYPFIEVLKLGFSSKVHDLGAHPDIKNYHWKVISHIPSDILSAGLWRVAFNFIVLDAVLALILAMSSWLLAMARVSRKQVEEQLRKLSRAVEQSASSIVITDLDGTIEFVNPAFSKTTGYSYDEAVGQNPRVLKSDKMPPEVYQVLWETIVRGDVWQG